ncbi:aspartyl-tRNA synthetase [Trifolium pratense]|uniref:Aspartyl-tRNA synthetase n=1 Tax=Trifolium pratense TaxID=57577 RepID=A0A2K3N777_TRIPR|nr:aspartyl-tRNA synthetase [Trifolium pratense]
MGGGLVASGKDCYWFLVAQGDLELKHLDVKTTFLHCDLDEEIYMYQSEGYKVESKKSQLHVADYIYLLLYVDDMLIASKRKVEIDRLNTQLGKEFETKHLGVAKKILVVTPLAPHFKLSSKQYATTAKNNTYMVCVPYASVVGSLMYAMVCIRPNISQAISVVGRFMANPAKSKGMLGSSEMDFNIDDDQLLAEYMAITKGTKEALWLRGLLDDLGIKQEYVDLSCESQSAIHLAKNQVHHARTKHIDISLERLLSRIKNIVRYFMDRLSRTKNASRKLSLAHGSQSRWSGAERSSAGTGWSGAAKLLGAISAGSQWTGAEWVTGCHPGLGLRFCFHGF